MWKVKSQSQTTIPSRCLYVFVYVYFPTAGRMKKPVALKVYQIKFDT